MFTKQLGLSLFLKMKDFDHTNVNRFVGACTEAANICFVMFYCSKGSLKVSIAYVLLNIPQTY